MTDRQPPLKDRPRLNSQAGPWFLYDDSLTPQEFMEAKKDWLENEKLMKELKEHLAKPITYEIKEQASTPVETKSKPTKAERLKALAEQEKKWQKESDRLVKAIGVMEGYEERFIKHQQKAQQVMETFWNTLPSETHRYNYLHEAYAEKAQATRSKLDLRIEELQSQRSQATRKAHEAYLDHQALSNSDEE